MDFLLSGIGQYLSQAILHSFVIALTVEVIMRSNHIQEPLLQIKFRSLSLLLPFFSLPIVYFMYPPRASAHFRQQVAIFDSNQWLSLKLVGEVSLLYLVVVIIVLAVAFFLARELVPVIRYGFRRRPALPVLEKGRFLELDTLLANLARNMGMPEPEVQLSGETATSVYTTGRRVLVLSTSAIELLDIDELEAVIAHELAHFTGELLLLGRTCLVLRVLMFYNPVALLVYHRINNDTEKFCDDLAISFTGKRLALISGLLKILRNTTAEESAGRTADLRGQAPTVNTFENRAHLALVKERAERILHREQVSVTPFPNPRVVITAGLLLSLLFFVV
jgi:Zn-dependent protease with chaperone function